MSEYISVRPMRASELHDAVEWTAREGWHVSDNIMAAWYAIDPSGFLAAVDKEDNILGELHFRLQQSGVAVFRQ